MNTDTVKVGKKRNLQTAKKIAGQSGLWMAAAAILFLLIVFVKPYHNVIDAIPSPEYESVRLFYIWVLRLGIWQFLPEYSGYTERNLAGCFRLRSSAWDSFT